MFENLVGHVALSIHELINDNQVKDALEYFGWTTEPSYRADLVSFGNATSNVELRMRQGGGFVDAGIYSSMQAIGEQYVQGQFSNKEQAIGEIIGWLERFAGFDLFESTNSVEDIL